METALSWTKAVCYEHGGCYSKCSSQKQIT